MSTNTAPQKPVKRYGMEKYVLGADYDELLARRKVLQTALESIATNTCCDKCGEAALVARAALASVQS